MGFRVEKQLWRPALSSIFLQKLVAAVSKLEPGGQGWLPGGSCSSHSPGNEQVISWTDHDEELTIRYNPALHKVSQSPACLSCVSLEIIIRITIQRPTKASSSSPQSCISRNDKELLINFMDTLFKFEYNYLEIPAKFKSQPLNFNKKPGSSLLKSDAIVLARNGNRVTIVRGNWSAALW